MDSFIVPLIIGLVVAVAAASAASSRRYEAQWRSAADRLRLGYEPSRLFSRPKIKGAKDDLAVTIDATSSSGGSTGAVRTRYRIGYPPLGLGLRMSRQTGFTKAAAMFGVDDTQIGDTDFDEAFAIRTSDPQRLSVRLPADARRVLMALVEDYPTVKITDEQVSYEKSGVDRDSGTVVTTAQRLIEAARALQGASSGHAPTSPPPEVPIREPIPPPPPIMRPDPFDTGADFEPVRPLPASRPEPEQEKPAPARETLAPGPSGPTATTVAGELFGKKGLSFQIARLFEDKYQGSVIDWPGEVTGVITGIGPNDPTRVTALVTTVGHELFGSVDVEVVASIAGRVPRDLAEGQPVNLRGTLSGIDATGRRLYVEDARLT